MSPSLLRKSLAKTNDAHPPLLPIEVFVELLGVVARKRRRPTGRLRVLGAVAADASPILVRGGDGSNNIETEKAR
jgi:hypothetical protein